MSLQQEHAVLIIGAGQDGAVLEKSGKCLVFNRAHDQKNLAERKSSPSWLSLTS